MEKEPPNKIFKKQIEYGLLTSFRYPPRYLRDENRGHRAERKGNEPFCPGGREFEVDIYEDWVAGYCLLDGFNEPGCRAPFIILLPFSVQSNFPLI